MGRDGGLSRTQFLHSNGNWFCRCRGRNGCHPQEYQIRRTRNPVGLLLPTNCLGVSRPHEQQCSPVSFFPTLVAGFLAVLVMTEKLPFCFIAFQFYCFGLFCFVTWRLCVGRPPGAVVLSTRLSSTLYFWIFSYPRFYEGLNNNNNNNNTTLTKGAIFTLKIIAVNLLKCFNAFLLKLKLILLV